MRIKIANRVLSRSRVDELARKYTAAPVPRGANASVRLTHNYFPVKERQLRSRMTALQLSRAIARAVLLDSLPPTERQQAKMMNFGMPGGMAAPLEARNIPNRHDKQRWLRRLREVARVASDLLEGGERGRAIGVLLELVDVEDAVEICTPPRRLSDHVRITVQTRVSAEDMQGVGLLPSADDAQNALEIAQAQVALAEVEELWSAPPAPYTDEGIPLFKNALTDAIAAYDEQLAEDHARLTAWASVLGIRRGDGEDDDALRARMATTPLRRSA